MMKLCTSIQYTNWLC